MFIVLCTLFMAARINGMVSATEIATDTFHSEPRTYTVQFTEKPPVIDGHAQKSEWRKARWSTPFVDIEGADKPLPAFATRMKMLWDPSFLYILIDVEEPDLWATLTNQDDIIFRDHDVEVFIDPDGDTYRYIEIEINALGTVMDLFMDKPYKKGGRADLTWNATGLKKAVGIRGTLNEPGDTDSGWTVEMAIPFDLIGQTAGVAKPQQGTEWRINFSRVEWLMEKDANGYRKKTGPAGKPLPEQNWVWSPQGLIDMHVPERWGIIRFRN